MTKNKTFVSCFFVPVNSHLCTHWDMLENVHIIDKNIFIVTVKRNDHTQQWNETLELTVNHEKLKKIQ